MDRMACVDLPTFPLQLLLKEHPEWLDYPAVVVDKDKPQGIILWANKRARAYRILPGMRYAAGLALTPELRAGEVPPASVAAAVKVITSRLQFFTPDVEPSPDEPGVFWANAKGLSPLYESLKKWAGLVRQELANDGYHAAVAVGFTRFGTYAQAKTGRGISVFNDVAEETRNARRISITSLRFEPKLRDRLLQLGVNTLGGFIDLPANGIRRRFGDDAHRLYRLASDDLFSPLDAVPIEVPVEGTVTFDFAEADLERLLSVVESLLQPLLVVLMERCEVLVAVTVAMRFEFGGESTQRITPARPTVELHQLLELLRLRLAATEFPSGVEVLTMRVEGVRATRKQIELFSVTQSRDVAAIDRAFARLRAEFGDDAVQQATLKDAHLPEARYSWEPMSTMPPANPRAKKRRPLVRRIFESPVTVRTRVVRDREDVILRHIREERIREIIGPYIVAGGWWMRSVHREYFFVRTEDGPCYWVYFDHTRDRLVMQGELG